MSFEEIMKDITAALTGNPDHDLQYLQEQSEKYKDSEYAKEILRACGRLMYDCIPEDKKEKLNDALRKDQLGIDAAIEEANYNIYKGNYEKGEKILRDMVKALESEHMYEDDSVSEYHTFTEPMQEILYKYLERPGKEIRRITEPYSELYLAYGSCLHGMRKYEEALSALERALRWNPADVRIIFEYGETWKRLGDLEQFFECNRQAHRYALHAKDVARCCRNDAYYFVEKKEWAPAVGFLLLCRQFDPENATAGSELYYIQNTAGEAYREPPSDEMEIFAQQHDIPFGPSEDVIGIAYQLAEKCLSNGSYDIGEYFARIAHDLAGAKETRDLLSQIRAHASRA